MRNEVHNISFVSIRHLSYIGDGLGVSRLGFCYFSQLFRDTLGLAREGRATLMENRCFVKEINNKNNKRQGGRGRQASSASGGGRYRRKKDLVACVRKS